MTDMKDEMELNLDELENVNGGAGNGREIIAYCRSCGQKLLVTGSKKSDGRQSTTYKCMNVNCTQYDKEKLNGDVDF